MFQSCYTNNISCCYLIYKYHILTANILLQRKRIFNKRSVERAKNGEKNRKFCINAPKYNEWYINGYNQKHFWHNKQYNAAMEVPPLKTKNLNPEYEHCVLCGKCTAVPKNEWILCRSNYIEGCGQLCPECMKMLNKEKAGADLNKR